MKKRRGAALPAAIVLCTLLLIVSFTVGFLVVNTSVNNRRIANLENQRIDYETAFHQFVEDGGDISVTPAAYSSNYQWTVSVDGDVKALTAYTKLGTLCFYAIYDFDSTSPKVLAYQYQSFYVYESGGDRYLGGLIPEVTPSSSEEGE